uniref:Uncharacterized protein LOC105141207 isoform X1 n=1 Tax=Rhizophora mucronata TaxID=61149 RepID=A0A2P2JAE1_RHIMU
MRWFDSIQKIGAPARSIGFLLPRYALWLRQLPSLFLPNPSSWIPIHCS